MIDGASPVASFTLDIARARKKLRQAEFFLSHAHQETSAPHTRTDWAEFVEFYTSACLTAAKSAYYVFDQKGSPRRRSFQGIQRSWRTGLPGTSGRFFGSMMGLRDDDVHAGAPIGTPQSKYVPMSWRAFDARHMALQVFGPRADIEAQNPDGTTVRGAALTETIGFYTEHQGRQIDALSACRDFIDLLTTFGKPRRGRPRVAYCRGVRSMIAAIYEL